MILTSLSVMLKCVASEGLEQLAELMSQGKLKVHLDRCAYCRKSGSDAGSVASLAWVAGSACDHLSDWRRG
jgi:hypothetical protein